MEPHPLCRSNARGLKHDMKEKEEESEKDSEVRNFYAKRQIASLLKFY